MDFLHDPNLVLYLPLYDLDGTSFMSRDAYGHRCISNGALWHLNGRTFDGTDDFIDTGSPFQSTFQGSFSLGGWIKPDDGRPATINIIFGVNDNGPEMQVEVQLTTAGRINFVYESDDNIVRAETDDPMFTDGAQGWHQVFCVADSTIGGVGGLKVYFDGVAKTLDATNNGNTAAATFANYVNALNPYIGAENRDGVANLFWNGSIGEFWIYNRALSPQEIQHNYLDTKWRYR